ncbi:MAG: O-antigen ligase family protein [Bacteroidia bacterium]
MYSLRDIFPETDKPFRKIMVALLVLVAFSLPFKFLVNLFIVLAFVAWLFSNPFNKLFTKTKNTPVLLAILVFYLLHLIGLIFTDNMGEGLFSLEIKVSMLIFPLLFYTEEFSAKQHQLYFKSFIIGTLLCCLLCLSRAIFLYCSIHENNFYYEGLSWFQHPSYLAMYVSLCCAVLLLTNLFTKSLTYLSIVFFTLFVFLLSSKTGIVIHLITLVFCIASLFLKGKNYFKIIGVSLIGLLVCISILFFIPQVKQRFIGASDVLQTKNLDKTSTESTAVRMLIWNEALQICKQHPLLGVSPGNANDALFEAYQKDGLTDAYNKKLNAHSQYFQIAIGLGLVGLLSLLSLFVVPLFANRNKMVFLFVGITALNFLTESMFQAMAGCIFFGYFYGLICFHHDTFFTTTD